MPQSAYKHTRVYTHMRAHLSLSVTVAGHSLNGAEMKRYMRSSHVLGTEGPIQCDPFFFVGVQDPKWCTVKVSEDGAGLGEDGVKFPLLEPVQSG